MWDGDGEGWGGWGGVIGMTHRYRVIGVVLTAFKQIMKNVYICTACQCSSYNEKKANAERTKAEPERKQTEPSHEFVFQPRSEEKAAITVHYPQKETPFQKTTAA